MNLAMVVSSGQPEVLWKALRLADLMLNENDEVSIFLNGPAVEFRRGDCAQFPLNSLAKTFVLSDGTRLA